MLYHNDEKGLMPFTSVPRLLGSAVCPLSRNHSSLIGGEVALDEVADTGDARLFELIRQARNQLAERRLRVTCRGCCRRSPLRSLARPVRSDSVSGGAAANGVTYAAAAD